MKLEKLFVILGPLAIILFLSWLFSPKEHLLQEKYKKKYY
jgi:hypothetical protein